MPGNSYMVTQWWLHYYTKPCPFYLTACCSHVVYNLLEQMNYSSGSQNIHNHVSLLLLLVVLFIYEPRRNIKSLCQFKHWWLFLSHLHFTHRQIHPAISPHFLSSALVWVWLLYHYAVTNLVHWHLSKVLILKPYFTQLFLMQHTKVQHSLLYYVLLLNLLTIRKFTLRHSTLFLYCNV